MRFPLAGWAWPPGPRVAAAHDSGVDGRGDGREKGPMQTTSGPQRDKTRPAARLDGINRYKTLPARPKTLISAHFLRAGRTFYRFRHQQPEQGELYPACRAASGTKLSPLAASAGDTGRKLSQHTSSYRNSAKKFAQQAIKRHFWGFYRALGELFRTHARAGPSRAKIFARQHPTTPQQRTPLQISHAIRLHELSTKPRNVAIPTI